MKTVKRIIAGFVVIAFFAVGYILILLPRGEALSEKQARARRQFTVDGTLEADEVDVAAKLPGRVSALHVKEGDLVKAGQLLAELEADEVDAKYEQAQAGVRAAQALADKARIAGDLERATTESRVEQARAGVNAAQAALNMAQQKLAALERGARPQEKKMVQQELAAAQAAFDTAEKTWNRVNSLAQEGVVPQQRADEVEMKYLSAKAQLTAMEAKVEMVNEGARVEEVEAAREQVSQAQAGVEAARQTLRQAEEARAMVDIRLKDEEAARQSVAAGRGVLDEVKAYKKNTRITSPVQGRVTERMVRTGEIVAPGYAMLSVTRVDGYWVDVYVDETQFVGRAVGDAVTVEIPALGRRLPGRITQIQAAADFATQHATNESGSFDVRGVKVRVSPDGDVRELAAGLTARVHFR